jgi:hypothetical protein
LKAVAGKDVAILEEASRWIGRRRGELEMDSQSFGKSTDISSDAFLRGLLGMP